MPLSIQMTHSLHSPQPLTMAHSLCSHRSRDVAHSFHWSISASARSSYNPGHFPWLARACASNRTLTRSPPEHPSRMMTRSQFTSRSGSVARSQFASRSGGMARSQDVFLSEGMAHSACLSRLPSETHSIAHTDPGRQLALPLRPILAFGSL